jgi:hypothetical protein
VLGDGGLGAAVDSYGDVVDLRAPGPAGETLIENPLERQRAGSVPATTGIVPRLSRDGGAPRPLWSADAVRQRYLAGTNVLRTAARFGGSRVLLTCGAHRGALGCVGRGSGRPAPRLLFRVDLLGGEGRVELGGPAARRIVMAAVHSDRRWLARARPLGNGAPAWAERLYLRSLLVLRALVARNGAVEAGARDGWAYVWPRDAAAAAIALESAGFRLQARRVARFLLGLGVDEAARFDREGAPVAGRPAEGDAAGWVAAAARATGLSRPHAPTAFARFEWRNRPDYQEKAPGELLGNAVASTALVGGA